MAYGENHLVAYDPVLGRSREFTADELSSARGRSVVISRNDLLFTDGVPLGGTAVPDANCSHCGGNGIVMDHRFSGASWPCVCSKPEKSDTAFWDYWSERMSFKGGSKSMSKEQELEKQLAELRKARNLLTNRVEDAPKKSDAEKTKLFDDAVALIRTWLAEEAGKSPGNRGMLETIGEKAMVAVLGTDWRELVSKL